MFLIAHMGDPRVNVSGPARMLPIARTFPRLRCIAAHLGNWGDWDIEKIRPIAKLPNVYTDISSSFSYVQDKSPLYPILAEYDPSHVFFGSDYPICARRRSWPRQGPWACRRTFWRTSSSATSPGSTTTGPSEKQKTSRGAVWSSGGLFFFFSPVSAPGGPPAGPSSAPRPEWGRR